MGAVGERVVWDKVRRQLVRIWLSSLFRKAKDIPGLPPVVGQAITGKNPGSDYIGGAVAAVRKWLGL